MQTVPPPADKKVRSPESRFWDSVKGRPVVLSFVDERPPLPARLIWVDRYTIGVVPFDQGDTITLIFKSALVKVAPGQL